MTSPRPFPDEEAEADITLPSDYQPRRAVIDALADVLGGVDCMVEAKVPGS